MKDDYDENYGEGGEGSWIYQTQPFTSDKEDTIDNIIERDIDNLEYDLDYEERKEYPDEFEIDRLKEQIDYVKSDEYRKEIEGELEWEPYMTFEEYVDMAIDNWVRTSLIDTYLELKKNKYSVKTIVAEIKEDLILILEQNEQINNSRTSRKESNERVRISTWIS